MHLRAATFDDWELLLQWRNDATTRMQSIHSEIVDAESHKKWLKASLTNASRKLYICEENNTAVGTVRSDFIEGAYVISWTVAPDHRGKGLGKIMVELLVASLSGPVHALIKKDNIPSQKIAEYAGMQLLEALPENILKYGTTS